MILRCIALINLDVQNRNIWTEYKSTVNSIIVELSIVELS